MCPGTPKYFIITPTVHSRFLEILKKLHEKSTFTWRLNYGTLIMRTFYTQPRLLEPWRQIDRII